MGKVIPFGLRRRIGALQRWGRRQRASSRARSNFRIAEMTRLFQARYGPCGLPDDDAGRGDVDTIAEEFMNLDNGVTLFRAWVAAWAPWVPVGDLERLCARKPRRWAADAVGRRLHLSPKERAELAIRTIGAIGITKRMRKRMRRESNRKYLERRRRAAGAVPRVEAKANRKPWEAFGWSRAKWYRNGCPEPPPPHKSL